MIKIEFNKQIIDRCDSKIDFREKKLANLDIYVAVFTGIQFY